MLSALRATVAPQAVVIKAPMPAARARLVQCGAGVAGEAIVSDPRHRSLDPALVAGMPHACGIDVKVARFGVTREMRA